MNDDNNYVVISYDNWHQSHLSFRIEKRVSEKYGVTRNWEDEHEWQDLGFSDKYKRYHLTTEQYEKFCNRQTEI